MIYRGHRSPQPAAKNQEKIRKKSGTFSKKSGKNQESQKMGYRAIF